MDVIKQFFENNYLGENGAGVVVLIIDIVIVLFLIGLMTFELRQKIKISRLIVVAASLIVLYFVSLIFEMKILEGFIKYIANWAIGLYIIIYSSEIKTFFEGKKNKGTGDTIYKSKREKEVTISTICSTIEYLSKRKIGALITFERKDSLEAIINNAIIINADITQEILTTIFTPGTACHDGGVIIRNNKIVCAGAYYTLSDNYEVPKNLGTRHRAALGVSERFDAITIIVSEETGNISIAVGGKIDLELTIGRVANILSDNLGTE